MGMDYEKAYRTLHNAASDAIILLENGKVRMARNVLLQAQLRAEWFVIPQPDEEEQNRIKDELASQPP